MAEEANDDDEGFVIRPLPSAAQSVVSELTNAVESTYGRSYNKALASTRSDIAIAEEDADGAGEDEGVEEDYYNTTMDDDDDDVTEDVSFENETSEGGVRLRDLEAPGADTGGTAETCYDTDEVEYYDTDDDNYYDGSDGENNLRTRRDGQQVVRRDYYDTTDDDEDDGEEENNYDRDGNYRDPQRGQLQRQKQHRRPQMKIGNRQQGQGRETFKQHRQQRPMMPPQSGTRQQQDQQQRRRQQQQRPLTAQSKLDSEVSRPGAIDKDRTARNGVRGPQQQQPENAQPQPQSPIGRVLQEKHGYNRQQNMSQPQPARTSFHHRRTLPRDHPSNRQDEQDEEQAQLFKNGLQKNNSNITDVSATSAKSTAALDGYVPPSAEVEKIKKKGGFLKKRMGRRKAKKIKNNSPSAFGGGGGGAGIGGGNKQKLGKVAATPVAGSGKKKFFRRRRKTLSGANKENRKMAETEEQEKKKVAFAAAANRPPSTVLAINKSAARHQQQQRPELPPPSPIDTQYQFEGYSHLKSPRTTSPPLQPAVKDNVSADISPPNNNANDFNPWANMNSNAAPSPPPSQQSTSNQLPPGQQQQPNIFADDKNEGPPPDGQVNPQGSGMPAFKWWTWKQSSPSSNENNDPKGTGGQDNGEDDPATTYFAFLCMFPPISATK